MSRLCELAHQHGSDKVKSIFHNYTPFYEELLKGRTIRRVLEIGIGTPVSMCHVPGYVAGASLRMWRDYFPDAEVWGLDNDPSALFEEHRIHTMLCDQGDSNALEAAATKLGGSFDLIIDDGSHQYPHQGLTANVLIPKLLSHEGVYCIEDVMYRRELYALLPFPTEVKVFNLGRTWDDCIFYIEGKWIR